MYEIVVFCDNDSCLVVSYSTDFAIRRPVSLRKIKCVDSVITRVGQPDRKASGKLRVDEKPHAAWLPARLN
jgi:hypothetical protein